MAQNKNATFFSPKMLYNRKEQRSMDKPRPDTSAVLNEQGDDHKPAKSASRREHVTPRGNDVTEEAAKPSVKASAAKTQSLKDEGKFSDYIRKVKDKMRTVSNVGAGKTATRRDSFNDKVSHYINRAKIKIRTTSNVGSDKDVSVK